MGVTAAAEIVGIPVAVWSGLAAVVAVVTGVLKFGGWIAKWRVKPRVRLMFEADKQPVESHMFWNDRYRSAKLSIVRLGV
jgi:hypothetical protein